MAVQTVALGPFSRLEGDLKVKVDIEEGRIVRARASGTLYRGFEPMVRGRTPLDAIVITCRVCGQCGLTHSAAAAEAIRSLTGDRMPRNARLAINVMLAIETVLSHLTHFYLSFAPDLAEPPCQDAARRFAPPAGESFRRALLLREDILGVLGLFAGKWPNSLAIQPGGTTRPLDASELRRAQVLLREFIASIEQQVLRCGLDRWLALRCAPDLDRWLGEGDHGTSDLGVFLTLGRQRGLDQVGRWSARFLSSGGWPDPSGRPFMKAGFHDGNALPFDPARIVEHVKHSWYDASSGALHPFDGTAIPSSRTS
ncbi:MAG: nickel-dependent hydrogenase large subunit [Candidatus Riflebacteria bacterium]|nr:nickel-dependent hydrogenase large subunit [Candidatus Riflebacteria bacterium]